MRTHWLDIVVFVILAIAAVKGWKRGFVLEVLNILGLLVGVVAGFLLHDLVADAANQYLHLPQWIVRALAFIITAVVVARIWNWLSMQATESFKVSGLGVGDSILGGTFGLLKASLVLAAVFWFLSILHVTPIENQRKESYLAADVIDLGYKEFGLLSKTAPTFKRWWHQAGGWQKTDSTTSKPPRKH